MCARGHWTWSMFVEHAEDFAGVLFRADVVERATEEAKALRTVFDRAGVPGGGSVLDLCCGIGRHAIPLAEAGYRVTGVDLSPYFIQMARERAREAGVADRTRFVVGDAREVGSLLGEEGPFDAVLCLWTSIGYFDYDDDVRMLSGARSLAKPGAVLVLDTENRDWIVANFCHSFIRELGAVEVHQVRELDLARSVLVSRWRLCERRDGTLAVKAEVKMELRLYAPHELMALLRDAGWEPEGIYASLALDELRPSSKRLVALARAPG